MDRKAGSLSEPTGPDTGATGDVVRLPTELVSEVPVEQTPPGGLHGLAIAGMAISALVGIASMLAFITIGWPGNSSRYVIGVFALATIGFMVSGSAAVFSAARDTYSRSRSGHEPRE